MLLIINEYYILLYFETLPITGRHQVCNNLSVFMRYVKLD